MAQKTEQEETEFKAVPETITHCVKCGVVVNSAANDVCQKCFTSSASSIDSPKLLFGKKSFRSVSCKRSSPERSLNPPENESPVTVAAAPPVRRAANRCFGCRRKVGLTGFRCRCGDLYCSEHRYSDRHDCSYDYKTSGREAIARENPVVKAAKIVKI